MPKIYNCLGMDFLMFCSVLCSLFSVKIEVLILFNITFIIFVGVVISLLLYLIYFLKIIWNLYLYLSIKLRTHFRYEKGHQVEWISASYIQFADWGSHIRLLGVSIAFNYVPFLINVFSMHFYCILKDACFIPFLTKTVTPFHSIRIS